MRLARAKCCENFVPISKQISCDGTCLTRHPAFRHIRRKALLRLMPTSDGAYYGFKYVNGHPANMARGFQTVTAFGVLAKVCNGYPVLFTEMTILTALRTAATSAMAAKYLAPSSARTMAMIGNGAQCEFQVLAFQEILGIDTIHLFDIDPKASEKAARNLRNTGLSLAHLHQR